ncbi:hypothetical protein BDP67DRAFT_517006, partial [Colletotrichum lupini]
MFVSPLIATRSVSKFGFDMKTFLVEASTSKTKLPSIVVLLYRIFKLSANWSFLLSIQDTLIRKPDFQYEYLWRNHLKSSKCTHLSSISDISLPQTLV